MTRTLIADLETDGYLENVTRIWCIGVYDVEANAYTEYTDHRPGAPSLEEGLARLQAADVVVGHNFLGYDHFVIKKLHPTYAVDRNKIRDTQVMSRLHDPSKRGGHNLDNIGETVFKSKKHDFKDFTRYSDAMSEYLKQDVRLTYRVWRWLSKELEGWGESIEIEHAFAYLMALQMQNGFGFDVARARRVLGDALQIQSDLEKKLKAIFPPMKVPKKTFVPKADNKKLGYTKGVEVTTYKMEEFNPGSRPQIAKRLMAKYGWRPTVFTNTGIPQISEEVLATLTFDEVPALLEYLRVEKKIGMLDGKIKKDGSGGGWLKHERNGRVYGYVNSNGAVTGRCTHSKPNVAQADSDEDMRACWIARNRWVLLGADAEGIEARALAHYLHKYDGGKYAFAAVDGNKEDGTDIHTMNKKNVGLFNRGGAGQRGAKNILYADIYGGGDGKLGELVIGDAVDAGKYNPTDAPHLFKTDKNGKIKPRSKSDLGEEARAKLEVGIVGFQKLVSKVKFTVRNKGFLTGIDGRKLWIRSPHSALNSLLQGFGAIIMKKALVLFHNKIEHEYGKTIFYCANVHDEIQAEVVDQANAERLGALFADCIREAGEHFGSRCPLAGTFVVGENWSQTH